MKFPVLASLFMLTTVASSAKVSYDGAKAFRIPVGEDVTPLMDIIHKLSLPIWKGAPNGIPLANSHVDLVVPAAKVSDFAKMTASMQAEVMHEDLGLAIAAEGMAASDMSSKLTIWSRGIS